jgi:protocatechuate 3,4-dioxygenase beta subunit
LLLTANTFTQNPVEPRRQDSSKEAETCTVQGQVVSAATGEPLKAAQVILIERSEGEHPEGLTDSSGHFVITGVPAGAYHFRAVKPGYVEQAYHPDAAGPAALLRLAPGEKRDKVLFRLARAAVIVGRIIDETGEPLVGVQVVGLVSKISVLDQGQLATAGLTPFQIAFTNDLGEYRLYNLPPGAYYIAASDARVHLGVLGGERPPRGLGLGTGGFSVVTGEHPLLYYPGVTRPSEAQNVRVSAGQEARADLSLRPVKMVTVSGRVVDANGRPAAQWVVHLRPQANVAEARENVDETTDAQGRFEIRKVLPGSYTISADVRVDDNQREDTRYWTEQQIEVAGDDVSGLQLQLSGDLEISGKVNTAGGEKLDTFSRLLALEDETDSIQGQASAYPNKDGTFTVLHVRRTTYRLRYWLPDGWYVRTATFGSQNVQENGLRLAGGDTGHSLEITVSPAVAQVEGLVLRGDDPVPGAMVKLFPDPDNPFHNIWPQTTWTDPNGHFVMKNIAPASYRAMAFDVEADPGEDDDDLLGVSITLAEKEAKTVKLHLGKTHE